MRDFDSFYFLLILFNLLLVGAVIVFWRRRKRAEEYSRKLVIGWNIFLTAMLVSLAFFGAETYYRFFVDRTDSFGLNKLSKRWVDRHYVMNNFDTRDNIDYSLQIAPGKRRVTIIGDSFTAGHGLENVNDRFANLFREAHPELEVHVMAQNGMETYDEGKLIEQMEKGGYQFDIILWVYNMNDIAPMVPETETVYDKIYAFEEELGYFGENSYFINWLLFRLKAQSDEDVRNYYSYLKDSYLTEAGVEHFQGMANMLGNMRARGWQVLAVNFPFINNLGPQYEFRGVHNMMNNFWADQNVPALDLLPVFEPHAGEDLMVNPYDAHPNEAAHKIAAEAINEFVVVTGNQ